MHMQISDTSPRQNRCFNFEYTSTSKKSADAFLQFRAFFEGLQSCSRPPVKFSHVYFTRETYSPLRVSTLITSPICTNNGTRTTAPVDKVAGLPPVPAVSPFRPGSVSVISNSTKFGGATLIGFPFHKVKVHTSCSTNHFLLSPTAASSAASCSNVSLFMKCQNSPSL